VVLKKKVELCIKTDVNAQSQIGKEGQNTEKAILEVVCIGKKRKEEEEGGGGRRRRRRLCSLICK